MLPSIVDRRLTGSMRYAPKPLIASRHSWPARRAIPVYLRPLGPLLAKLQPPVLVDARMRKHAAAEVQRGLTPVTIGLGPNFELGRTCDLAVETSWDQVGPSSSRVSTSI
jgi:hypothetical protein